MNKHFTLTLMMVASLLLTPLATWAASGEVVAQLGAFFTYQDDHINAPDDKSMNEATVANNKASRSLQGMIKDSAAKKALAKMLAVNDKILALSAKNNDDEAKKLADTDMSTAYANLRKAMGMGKADKTKALAALDEMLLFQDDHIMAPDDPSMFAAEDGLRQQKGILFVELQGTSAIRPLRNLTEKNWEIMVLSWKNDDQVADKIAQTEGKDLANTLRSAINGL